MTIDGIKDNASYEYVYSLIDFNCEIIIDERLLGKSLLINTQKGGSYCIYFPKLAFNEKDEYDLISPLPFSTTNHGLSNWGRVLRYSKDVYGNVIDKIVAISAIWVVTYTSEMNRVTQLGVDSEWFIRCLHSIAPKSIILKRDDSSKLVSNHSYSYFDTNTGRSRVSGLSISLTIYKDSDITKVGTKLIKTILNAYGKQVALPYDILLCAFNEYQTKNYRNTILNCAMTIEVSLKHVLRYGINRVCKKEKLTEYLIRNSDGLRKIEGMMKSIGMNILHKGDVWTNIFDLRNRIIHGGFSPTQAQALTALNLTQSTLKLYEIPYFD